MNIINYPNINSIVSTEFNLNKSKESILKENKNHTCYAVLLGLSVPAISRLYKCRNL